MEDEAVFQTTGRTGRNQCETLTGRTRSNKMANFRIQMRTPITLSNPFPNGIKGKMTKLIMEDMMKLINSEQDT
jgi:hypothetical protein